MKSPESTLDLPCQPPGISSYFSLPSQTSAEMHYQKALNIRRERLGENHVSVASVLHKLASALISKGDYDDSLSILQQSQGI